MRVQQAGPSPRERRLGKALTIEDLRRVAFGVRRRPRSTHRRLTARANSPPRSAPNRPNSTSSTPTSRRPATTPTCSTASRTRPTAPSNSPNSSKPPLRRLPPEDPLQTGPTTRQPSRSPPGKTPSQRSRQPQRASRVMKRPKTPPNIAAERSHVLCAPCRTHRTWERRFSRLLVIEDRVVLAGIHGRGAVVAERRSASRDLLDDRP